MPVIMNGITSPWCLGYRRGLRRAVAAVVGGSSMLAYRLRANACWSSSSWASRDSSQFSVLLASFAVALADFFWHSQVALDCCAVIVASARFRRCGRAINCGEHPGRGYLRNAGVRARGRRVHAMNEKVARSQVVDEGPRAVRWSQVEEAFYVGNYRGNFVGYIDRGPDGAFRLFDSMSTLRGEASTLEESMACLDALFFATSGDRGRQ